MNKFSRSDENQAAFMAWFNSLSADVKLAYLEAYKADTLDVYAVLRHAEQADGWLDTLIDQLFTFGDEFSGVANISRAHDRFTELAADGMAENDALRVAAAEFDVKPADIVGYMNEGE